jgi:NTE family protein
MKTAIVLSGGGAKGAFQAGVVAALAQKGVSFDCVSGVSVGSLNGAMIAQDRLDDMIHVWQTVHESDVFSKYSLARVAVRVLKGIDSIYDNSPLKDLLHQYVDIERVQKWFSMGFVSLYDGQYYYGTKDLFSSNDDFIAAIHASATMPVYWTPTEVNMGGRKILQTVDGGVRNVTPLADVIAQLPDHIYVVSCDSGQIDCEVSDNVVKIFMRTLDILLSEIVDNDVDRLQDINMMVQQAGEKGIVLKNRNGKELKHFEYTYIKPPRDLGSPLDFSASNLKEKFSLGLAQIP